MNSLYFATNNRGKINAFQQALNPFKVKVLPLTVPLIEPQTADLRQIAGVKVRQAYRQTETPVVAQDSGFFLHGWNGFPGPFVKFALETIGLIGLLKLVEESSKECEFRSCWAYLDKTLERPIFFEDQTVGKLAEIPRGQLTARCWSDLWLVFIPDGSSKTLAEKSQREHELRHQQNGNRAIDKLAAWIGQQQAGK